MTRRRSKPSDRPKQAKQRRKKLRAAPSQHWLSRHEAEREAAEEAMARRMTEDDRHV